MAISPRTLQTIRLIDLSVPLTSQIAEPEPPSITYQSHRQSASALAEIASRLLQNDPGSIPLDANLFPDGIGLANETLSLDTHAGTHMDAPWHFGPLSEGRPAKTIDEIPLSWCFGPGVVLDLRHCPPGSVISPADLQWALARIHYVLSPGDIVLLMTGADAHYDQPDYFSAHPGMGREATIWLLDQGIRVMGIDAWGFDRPALDMLRDYKKEGRSEDVLPAHMVGREREYCHMEKLANLSAIPAPHGFWVACFPIKVHRGSAGWVRAVAMVPENSHAS